MHWHSELLRLASLSSSASSSLVLLLHIKLCLLTSNEPWMVPYSTPIPPQGEAPAGIGGCSPDPHPGEDYFCGEFGNELCCQLFQEESVADSCCA